jgi:hypothetical protein
LNCQPYCGSLTARQPFATGSNVVFHQPATQPSDNSKIINQTHQKTVQETRKGQQHASCSAPFLDPSLLGAQHSISTMVRRQGYLQHRRLDLPASGRFWYVEKTLFTSKPRHHLTRTAAAESTAAASSAQSTASAQKSEKDSSSDKNAASTTASGKSGAASSTRDSSDASTTPKPTGGSSGSNKVTSTGKSAKSKTYGVSAGYGGISMILPNYISSSSYYKVGNEVTFAWNMTSLSVTPTALDILATCTANAHTYTLAVNQTVNGTVGAVTWDTGAYQASATVPLLTETYTLIIMDAALPAVSATANYGALPVYSGVRFGMYTPQPYTNTSGNDTQIFTCVTCKSAASSLERHTLTFLLAMVAITVATFTIFVGGVGVI